MKKLSKTVLPLLTVASLYSWCWSQWGSSESDFNLDPDNTPKSTKTVKLVDSEIEWVKYKACEMSWITNKQWEITYPVWCKNISLSVWWVNTWNFNPEDIAEKYNDKIITLMDTLWIDRSDINSEKVKSLWVFYQSLDNDWNPDNWINIEKNVSDELLLNNIDVLQDYNLIKTDLEVLINSVWKSVRNTTDVLIHIKNVVDKINNGYTVFIESDDTEENVVQKEESYNTEENVNEENKINFEFKSLEDFDDIDLYFKYLSSNIKSINDFKAIAKLDSLLNYNLWSDFKLNFNWNLINISFFELTGKLIIQEYTYNGVTYSDVEYQNWKIISLKYESVNDNIWNVYNWYNKYINRSNVYYDNNWDTLFEDLWIYWVNWTEYWNLIKFSPKIYWNNWDILEVYKIWDDKNEYFEKASRVLDTPYKWDKFIQYFFNYSLEYEYGDTWTSPYDLLERKNLWRMEWDCDDYALFFYEILKRQWKNPKIITMPEHVTVMYSEWEWDDVLVYSLWTFGIDINWDRSHSIDKKKSDYVEYTLNNWVKNIFNKYNYFIKNYDTDFSTYLDSLTWIEDLDYTDLYSKNIKYYLSMQTISIEDINSLSNWTDLDSFSISIKWMNQILWSSLSPNEAIIHYFNFFQNEYVSNYSINYLIYWLYLLIENPDYDAWISVEVMNWALNEKILNNFWVDKVSDLPDTYMMKIYKDFYKDKILPKI